MTESNFDFSIPQRQSLIGVLVLFANTLQKIIRALWPVILAFVFSNKEIKPLFVYLTLFGILVFVALIAFLRYWFFQFYIDYTQNEFVIENGIFNKTKTTIPFHKIQKVTIDQSLIQRIFKVYKLELDTAGSDKKEASINAISHEMALELKRSLVVNVKENTIEDSEKEFDQNDLKSFITISLPSLLKIGVTSNYLISFIYLIGVFFTVNEQLKQIGKENLIEDNINQLERLPVFNLLFGFLIFSFTAIIITNLVITVVKYYGFTIKKDGKSFVLSYGLLNIKNTIIRPEKVQIIKLTQNYFQKRLNINTIETFQASSDENRAKAKDRTKIPGCNKIEKEQIVKLLIARLPNHDKILYPNIRKLIIRILFLIIIPVSIALVSNTLVNQFSITTILSIVSLYIVWMGLLLFVAFKNYKLYVSDDFIVMKNGAWDIDHSIILPFKIQAIKTQQFFWQKATNIGSVVMYTAGGRISFSTGNYKEIKELVNKWLYQVAVSKGNWM